MQYVKIIPTVLIDYLTPHQLKLLLYLKSHKKPGTYVSFAVKASAKSLRMGDKTVSKALKRLMELDIIREQYPPKKYKENKKWVYLPGLYSIHDGEIAAGFERAARIVAVDEDVSFRTLIQGKARENNNLTMRA